MPKSIVYGVVTLAIFAAVLVLAGCGSSAVVRDRPVSVSMPLPQPCSGNRPLVVPPLKEQIAEAQWADLDARQKSAHVGKQGLKLRAYGEQLNAATASCP